MKISARENKILNSLILKILLSKHGSISTLEVHMLDNFFILACLKKFSVTKNRKFCIRENLHSRKNSLKLVHAKTITRKALHETNFY